MKIGNLEVYGVIYKIKNKLNNKIYIGQTIQDGGFNTRYHGNLERWTHNKHLKLSISKYGIDNFEINKTFDVAFSQEELNIKEKLYISLYDSTNTKYGYNNSTGGERKGGILNIESKRRMSKAQGGNPVLCITSNIVFDSITEAGKYYNIIGISSISNCCKGKRKSSGKLEDGTPLTWKYCIGYRKVICVTTEAIFQSISEGAREYNIKSSSNITDCCKNKVKSAGRHPITNEKLVWMYYEDYLNETA